MMMMMMKMLMIKVVMKMMMMPTLLPLTNKDFFHSSLPHILTAFTLKIKDDSDDFNNDIGQ